MKLSAKELSELYSQIENKSDKEIIHLIDVGNVGDSETNKTLAALGGGALAAGGGGRVTILGHLAILNGLPPSSTLFEICKKYAKEFSTEIKAILKNNPKSTNYALNVIQLLAPAIAQQYSGIPAMAIVGSITLLCRQGLENFIK